MEIAGESYEKALMRSWNVYGQVRIVAVLPDATINGFVPAELAGAVSDALYADGWTVLEAFQ